MTEKKPELELTNQQIDALGAARDTFTFHERLLLAHIEIGELSLVKDAEAYNSKYIKLDKLLKQVKPILHKFGLTINFSTTQIIEVNLGNIFVFRSSHRDGSLMAVSCKPLIFF